MQTIPSPQPDYDAMTDSELHEAAVELIQRVRESYQRWQEDRVAQGRPALEPLSAE